MANRMAPVIDNFFHDDDELVDLFSTLIGSYVELEESGSDSSSVEEMEEFESCNSKREMVRFL